MGVHITCAPSLFLFSFDGAMENNVTTSPESTEALPTSAPTLTEQDKLRAALNLPADQFALGDRVFNIVDLPYDDYIHFVNYMTPFLELLVSRVSQKFTTVQVPGIEIKPETFNAASLITSVGKSLPEMVQIICRQTDPDITIAEVKRLAKKPTVLAVAVMKQIKQNGIIRDFSDFFGQVVGAMKETTANQ
jgi:hypothetical protein